MHNNSQLNSSFKCWMMLCCVIKPFCRSKGKDVKETFCCYAWQEELRNVQQAGSVLQFSKGIRYRNGTEHSKANYVGFLFPNALRVCLCVYKWSRETANIMKSNSWRIICEKRIHSPLFNPPYSESLLKKGKILPTFLLSMAKPSWLQQCSTPIFPPISGKLRNWALSIPSIPYPFLLVLPSFSPSSGCLIFYRAGLFSS